MDLTLFFDGVSVICRSAEIPPAPAECEALLASLDTVTYEVRGLAKRVRATCVNNTPVPHPVKPAPAPKPADPPKPAK